MKEVAAIFIVRIETWRVTADGGASDQVKVRTHEREVEDVVVLEEHSTHGGD